MNKLNPNSEAAVVGSTGHWPVPSGDSPLGTREEGKLFDAPFSHADVPPISFGQWPDDTSGSPVPLIPASEFRRKQLWSKLHSSLWSLHSRLRQATCRHPRVLRAALSGFLWWGALTTPVMAQGDTDAPQKPPAPKKEELSLAPAKVAVQPIAHDEEIRQRLQSVMEATGWFNAPEVKVVDGVVFLSGRADSDEIKKWAGDLARNTQDVVAVANRIEVLQPSAWDFSGARSGLSGLARDFIHSIPFLVIALFILALSAGAGWFTARKARKLLAGRVRAKLLRGVLAGGLGVIVFLAGTYIVLRVSGLTQLALTIVGGTGLVGLAVGIAFRDITENFLASIFLSMQQPFEKGDLVEVVGVTGYVQQLNVRTTVLMTLDGNLVQIPNAAVYKNTLRNFTVNPNRRENFVVGIGYDDAIDEAQEVALKVLVEHPAVLQEPEPLVLADDLGKATVNLRIYFWLNGHEHSWLKVRSSVIRLVKRAYQQHGISMPDEAREVVFPRGVPVTMLDAKQEPKPEAESLKPSGEAPRSEELDAVSTKAEAGLSSEAGTLEKQARQAKPLDEGENLLGAPTSVRPMKTSKPE
ncbi:MAG: mechanosensitive ion channel family protein [Verrucomicrobiota bacterium]